MSGKLFYELLSIGQTGIWDLWREAVLDSDSESLEKIRILLERNAKNFATTNYPLLGYRARVVQPRNYAELDLQTPDSNGLFPSFSGDSGLRGFPAEKMGAAPSNLTPEGRANFAKESVLYLASDIQTACSEVQPTCNDLISVIRFNITEGLTIIDFRDLPEHLQSVSTEKNTAQDFMDFFFCRSLCRIFSMPVSSRSPEYYKYSQFITHYLISQGIDGIIYRSSHNYDTKSYNFVLFNPDNATPAEKSGELFTCLSIRTTFQSVSKNYVEETVEILEAKREDDPYLWNRALMLYANISKAQGKE